MPMPRINLKLTVVSLLVCAAVGGLLSWLSDMPFWGGVLIAAAALLVNGLVAELEDRAPGGFLNPRNRDE